MLLCRSSYTTTNGRAQAMFPQKLRGLLKLWFATINIHCILVFLWNQRLWLLFLSRISVNYDIQYRLKASLCQLIALTQLSITYVGKGKRLTVKMCLIKYTPWSHVGEWRYSSRNLNLSSRMKWMVASRPGPPVWTGAWWTKGLSGCCEKKWDFIMKISGKRKLSNCCGSWLTTLSVFGIEWVIKQ
jgi:hypothetical protein